MQSSLSNKAKNSLEAWIGIFVCVEKLIFVYQTRVIPRLILGSKNSLYVTISQDAGLDGSWKEWQFKFLQAIFRADAGMVQINWAKNFYWWIHSAFATCDSHCIPSYLVQITDFCQIPTRQKFMKVAKGWAKVEHWRDEFDDLSR